jgi:hypothetical protein
MGYTTYVGRYGIAGMILFLIKRILLLFCRLFTLWFIGSALALLASGGSTGVHGYWMQPPSNACPGYFLLD